MTSCTVFMTTLDLHHAESLIETLYDFSEVLE